MPLWALRGRRSQVAFLLRQAGISAEFRSREFEVFGVIVLGPGDVLVWCPMIYVWVYCFLCQKFHFPADGVLWDI